MDIIIAALIYVVFMACILTIKSTSRCGLAGMRPPFNRKGYNGPPPKNAVRPPPPPAPPRVS